MKQDEGRHLFLALLCLSPGALSRVHVQPQSLSCGPPEALQSQRLKGDNV